MLQSKNVSLEESQKDGIIFSKNYIKYAMKTFGFLRQRKTLESTEDHSPILETFFISTFFFLRKVSG